MPPFPMPLGHHLRTGYLKRGATLAELAAQTGIDAKGLEATVASVYRKPYCLFTDYLPVCTENLIRVDDAIELDKLAE